MEIFKRLVKLISPYKGGMAFAALLGVATVGSGIGLMTTSAYLISAAALHPSVASLGVATVGVRFFGIARGCFRYLERYYSHQVTFRLLARFRVWFYRSIEPLAPARLQDYKSGDLLTRVVADIDTLQNFYLRVLAPPIVGAIVGLVMWLFFGAFNWIFAFTFLGFYLLAGVGVPLMAHLLSRKIGQEIITTRAELNVQMVDGVQGMAELVAFGQEDRQLARIATLNRKLVGLQQRQAWISGLETALSNLLMNLTMWTMLLVAIPLVQNGQLDGVYLALLVLGALSSFEIVLTLPQAFQGLGSSQQAAQRLFEITDAKPAVDQNAKPQSPNASSYDITFDNVRFAYHTDEPPALNGVSFALRQGQTLALVGPSGAGKSSVANLLLRFWDYQQGKITLGGYDLREFAPEEAQKLISLVSQSTHLFNTSIRENLAIARSGVTQEEIETACKQAQIHDFIISLPQGYNTLVGEYGANLSGGERQRLAIARAILKNAPILILDEATANLDSSNERAVLAAIQTLMQDRTTIIITHRLIGLENADEILVLQNGKIVEQGTQQKLLQHEGLFWRMWELQNRQEALAK